MAAKCYIGTSGWVYQHWRGRFYPDGLPQVEWFEFYAKHFDTVELNNSFYHLPQETTFINWHKRSPGDFIFSVKASRFITHIKRLRGCKEPAELFLKRAKLLKTKLGPILFQFPPHWQCQPQRLEDFLKLLPKNKRFVFEFRDPSWFNEKIYSFLKKKKFAFCQFDMPQLVTPEVLTADFTYIRMHGALSLYGGDYPQQKLNALASRIRKYLKKNLDVYVYFNNDSCAYAVKNAKQLKQLL